MFRSVNIENKVAHNSFISVLVELGVIGFALFVLILTIAMIEAARQTKWHSRFWVSVLVTWVIAASTLTLEYRKPTWLFLSLVVASAALNSRQGIQYASRNKRPQAVREQVYHV
jgi:O-antigen ligase